MSIDLHSTYRLPSSPNWRWFQVPWSDWALVAWLLCGPVNQHIRGRIQLATRPAENGTSWFVHFWKEASIINIVNSSEYQNKCWICEKKQHQTREKGRWESEKEREKLWYNHWMIEENQEKSNLITKPCWRNAISRFSRLRAVNRTGSMWKLPSALDLSQAMSWQTADCI